jgi:hypothetical protein
MTITVVTKRHMTLDGKRKDHKYSLNFEKKKT